MRCFSEHPRSFTTERRRRTAEDMWRAKALQRALIPFEGNRYSDIFYPDNPKRRARASQLSDDVNFFCNQFEQVKKKRNDLLEELNPRLGQLLKKYGYNSPEELDAAVRKVLKGDALAEYNQVREQVDKSDQFVTAMFQLTSLVGAVSGVFIGSLVVLGLMTGGVALGVIGIIGAVLGVIALIGFLFSVFDGAEERANMRKAIHDLSFEKVKARAAYEAMNALSNWVYNIKLWLDEPLIAEDEAIMRKKLEGDFANDYNKSKRSAVVSYLKSYDSSRSSWMNEDPNWWTGPEDILGASYSLPASKISSRRYFADRSAYLGDKRIFDTLLDFLRQWSSLFYMIRRAPVPTKMATITVKPNQLGLLLGNPNQEYIECNTVCGEILSVLHPGKHGIKVKDLQNVRGTGLNLTMALRIFVASILDHVPSPHWMKYAINAMKLVAVNRNMDSAMTIIVKWRERREPGVTLCLEMHHIR
ncbi:hypothetical protein AMATHDRAFT_8690 [Amanita thiersii Skay4041]|uniref:Uncharacterized protein n=1 Tax=Amanita thiersii Skay4041 TaxID=703135 RepID=A0A2A9NDH5_9AGAR|nr:hypothetical protein AMATHDRAFT_8690 [Amanita thiersii Skay4041]